MTAGIDEDSSVAGTDPDALPVGVGTDPTHLNSPPQISGHHPNSIFSRHGNSGS